MELLPAVFGTSPKKWLVTGSAGFIGSHLLETLLKQGQFVTSLDNFSTGHRRNLKQVREAVGEAAWHRHCFLEGDITDPVICLEACHGADIVLHEAAIGSVPRSIASPLMTHATNATGFLNMLDAARLSGVKRFVYAASSSTYGDSSSLPKIEHAIGRPLSPYAVTKYLNELYADVYARCYGIETIGLRYFNVFGARQDPLGPYAAVIPRWVAAMLEGSACQIHGDGETSRDFCYVANVVQANLLAASTSNPDAINQVFNVAYGQSITLNQLHDAMATILCNLRVGLEIVSPRHGPLRVGDIRHSLADISKGKNALGYAPKYSVRDGLAEALAWYVSGAKTK